MGTGLLTLSSHPHPAFPLPSFSPAFSIPHTSHSLALSLGTRPLLPAAVLLQVLTVLALTSFRLLPRLMFSDTIPTVPSSCFVFEVLIPTCYILLNSCSLVGCWSLIIRATDSMGANFVSCYVSQHLEQSLAYKINVENSWNFPGGPAAEFLTGNVGASRFNSWSRNAMPQLKDLNATAMTWLS